MSAASPADRMASAWLAARSVKVTVSLSVPTDCAVCRSYRAAEVVAQTVVDDLAQLLQSVQDLPGRVSALAAGRDACAVPRP